MESFCAPRGSQEVPEAIKETKHAVKAAPRGSGEADGSAKEVCPRGPGGPLAKIIEPMGPKRVPK